MHACDRQTDGQTDGQNCDSQDRPRICWRGKNCCGLYSATSNRGGVAKRKEINNALLVLTARIRGVGRGGGDEGVKTPPQLRDITVSADEILEEMAQKPRHLPFRLS